MNFTAKQLAATKKIRAKGREVTLEWDIPGATSFVSRTPAAPPTGQGKVLLIAFPFKLRNLGSDRFVDQKDILTNQRRIIMAAFDAQLNPLPGAPRIGDRILDWEGRNWTIDGLAPVAPDGDVVILYTGTMRSGQ